MRKWDPREEIIEIKVALARVEEKVVATHTMMSSLASKIKAVDGRFWALVVGFLMLLLGVIIK